MLKSQDPITHDMIKKEVGALLDHVGEEHSTENSENNASVYLLDILLNAQISLEDNKKLHVSDLIRMSLGKDVDTMVSITRDKAKDLLLKSGLKTDSNNNLLVHTKHDFLTTLFDRKNISGYASRLQTYPDCKKSKNPVRFSTSRNRALVIPIPEDLLAVLVEPMAEYKGEILKEFDDNEIVIK